MELARAIRDKAAASKAPRYAGNDSADAIVAFLQNELAPWLKSQATLISGAEEHYSKAYVAGSPSQQVAAASEFLGFLGGFIDQANEATESLAQRSRASLAEHIRQEMSSVLAPWRAHGRTAAANCVAAARKTSGDVDGLNICSEFPTKYPP